MWYAIAQWYDGGDLNYQRLYTAPHAAGPWTVVNNDMPIWSMFTSDRTPAIWVGSLIVESGTMHYYPCIDATLAPGSPGAIYHLATTDLTGETGWTIKGGGPAFIASSPYNAFYSGASVIENSGTSYAFFGKVSDIYSPGNIFSASYAGTLTDLWSHE
jgi:hypothetical protein